jgi:hypothetical protein
LILFRKLTIPLPSDHIVAQPSLSAFPLKNSLFIPQIINSFSQSDLYFRFFKKPLSPFTYSKLFEYAHFVIISSFSIGKPSESNSEFLS